MLTRTTENFLQATGQAHGRANIFGYPSVFGVMVDQSSEDEVDIMSTPELAARFGEFEVARYGQEFKDKAVARLLPPESASLKEVALSIGVSESTLERWRSEALANPTERREWTPAARFEAVLTTSMMDEASKGAWCRSNGVYPHELAVWREQAINALAQPGEKRLNAAEAKQDKRRIKEQSTG
eukprot:gene29609-36684_t